MILEQVAPYIERLRARKERGGGKGNARGVHADVCVGVWFGVDGLSKVAFGEETRAVTVDAAVRWWFVVVIMSQKRPDEDESSINAVMDLGGYVNSGKLTLFSLNRMG